MSHPRALIIILILCCFNRYGACQEIHIKHIEIFENKILLHYNLLDTVPGRSFTVRLYSSNDSYLTPLEQLSGDAGLEVRPGSDKKILWDPREQFADGDVKNVSLELRARVFVPFVNLESINHYKVFKRGRSYALTWTGGHAQNILNFDLYRGATKVTTFPNVANVGHHAFVFPRSVKPGKRYRFKVSDAKNKEDVVYTSVFRIARKTPLTLKAIPALAIIGGIGYLVHTLSEQPFTMPDPPAGTPN